MWIVASSFQTQVAAAAFLWVGVCSGSCHLIGMDYKQVLTVVMVNLMVKQIMAQRFQSDDNDEKAEFGNKGIQTIHVVACLDYSAYIC